MCSRCAASVGLTSALRLLRLVRLPPVPGALRRHLKRFTDELRMAATEEVNSLVLGCLGGSRQVAAGGLTGLVAGSLLCREAAALARVLEPIGSPRLAATFRQALLDCFTAATQVRARCTATGPAVARCVHARGMPAALQQPGHITCCLPVCRADGRLHAAQPPRGGAGSGCAGAAAAGCDGGAGGRD